MYSLEKCKNYIENELGMKAPNYRVVSYFNPCKRFDLRNFINDLNKLKKYDSMETIFSENFGYSDEYVFLTEILYENRNKYKCEFKYNNSKARKFLINQGYLIDNDNYIGLIMNDSIMNVGKLGKIIKFLNGNKTSLSKSELMICVLLKNNKDEVGGYV